jgi:transposase
MSQISTIGLDIAKHVFQVHGVDDEGAIVARRRLRRSEILNFFARLSPTLVGMEACATSHHWARELQSLGHEVRLMPAQYVKAYVKRQKNDAADAEAICEAVRRPSMRFVPVKSAEQQAALMLHRSRDLLVRQRTMLINALRGHLAEFGLIEARGPNRIAGLVAMLEAGDESIPECASQALAPLVAQLRSAKQQIEVLEAPDPCLAQTE